jgi:hypothetical protein
MRCREEVVREDREPLETACQVIGGRVYVIVDASVRIASLTISGYSRFTACAA